MAAASVEAAILAVAGPSRGGSAMIHRPAGINAFEFVVLSGLRAAQLLRGCIPRVEGGGHKTITTAQLEVATGKILRYVPVVPSD